MEVVEFPPRTVATILVVGPYGEGYPPVMARLREWLQERDIEPGRYLFTYLDDPDTVPPEQCRTEVGAEVPMAVVGTVEEAGEVYFAWVKGGRYAEARHVITDQTQYPVLWGQLYQEIQDAGLVPGDPSFELYHSVSDEPFRDDVSLCARVGD